MNIECTGASYPLSPMQQGMLFHNLSAGEPGVDLEQIFCRMHEAVDVQAFAAAWQRVVDRHEILRTTFHWEGSDVPLQTPHLQARLDFHVEDWRGKPVREQEVMFEAVLEADRQRGFNLAESPANRLVLFRLSDAVYQFLWTFHHLLLDGRGVVLVLNEVFAFYEALRRGEDLKLSPPPPYSQYVQWLGEEDFSLAEPFWRQYLKGFTAPTELGVAAPRDVGLKPIRGEQEIGLPESVTARLRSLAQTCGVTLNTMLQGAWALLLSRYCGEEVVVFGAVRACRRSNAPDVAATVGLVINTVPVRVRVAPGTPVVAWLKTVRAAWNALREVEHTPLSLIQGWTEVPRGQPLFHTIFNYQEPSWDAALQAQGGAWAGRHFGIRSQSNYPLAVDAYGGAAVLVKILYHRTRFDDAAVLRMLGHFKTILESIAARPAVSVDRLKMLTEGEEQELSMKGNGPVWEFPQDSCIHELFEVQARRTPDALAVADETNQWSYAELNGRADALASILREVGVGPDVCVGVCMERSVEMVAVKLAVWKAGGAYLPLDPSHPVERLQFVLEDARAPVVLTQRSLRDRLASQIGSCQWVSVDDRSPTTPSTRLNSNGESSLTPPAVRARNLAYVIYTSGSTGQPKGVAIEHRSLANLIAWHQRTYQTTPADRAAQVSTVAFDASVWELWPYLTCGASIHLASAETRLSARKLLRWLVDRKITLAFVPTPLAEVLFTEDWPEGCALRALLTGGDKLHRAPPRNFPCPLFNHYGPTENTVVTTWTQVPPEEGSTHAPPIGRPIANTQVWVLDSRQQPVPVGVTGELYVGGVGLARGYHGHPELTTDRFIALPVKAPAHLGPDLPGADPGTVRLYRTGDLVRWRADGLLEFLGRRDDQVKIRGQRIELGEIEAALARHPGVWEAVVVARENPAGENSLAAYIVARDQALLQPQGLHQFLRQKLPEAMVPSAFVLLEALPLTPNGKVDRKALPAPARNGDSGQAFVHPRTATELGLAAIWREVLRVQEIGVHDSFFELGGHSLNATQVVSRINGAFPVELRLQDLFDGPTLAELAEKIEGLARSNDGAASMERAA